MRTIKITQTRVRKKALVEAERALFAGEVVAFPTETAYGLAADPRNAEAVRKVFLIKGRSLNKSLPLIAASLADVSKHFVLNGKAAGIARKHWPGPLTIVLPFKNGSPLAGTGARAEKTARVAKAVNASAQKTGAVRVPASAWARAIARAAGGIVTSTSANISGNDTIYDGRKVVASFRGRRHAPAIVLDAGTLPQRPPSTIIGLQKGKVIVLRQGTVRL